MAQDTSQLAAIKLSLGVANRMAETKVPEGYARAAKNIDISNDGVISERDGYARFVALTGAHSLWGDPELPFALVGGASTLNRLDPNGAVTPLVTGLSGADIHYCMTPIGVYWSDGAQCGRIRADGTTSLWGVEVPAGLIAAATAGSLYPGVYGVSATYVDDGQEGGAPETVFVNLASGGGIAVQVPMPVDTSLIEARIYVTTADGQELQFAAYAAPGTTITIDAGMRGRPLRTQYLRPLPPMRYPALAKGRLFGAVGRYIIGSSPMYYGLYDPTRDYTAIRGQVVTMIAPSDAPGFLIYIGTDQRTYKLEGDSFENASLSVISHSGVMPGSMARVSPDAVKLDGLMNWVPVWVDQRGIPYAGTSGGAVQLHDKFAYPQFAQSASVFDQRNGNSRYIVSGRAGAPSNLAFSDYVSATVIDAGGGT